MLSISAKGSYLYSFCLLLLLLLLLLFYSPGNSAIFATDKPSLSLFPLKPVFMVNGTYKTLLVLDAPAPGTVPVVCSLERVSIVRININSSRLCEGAKGGPTVVNNAVALNGVSVQLQPQELEYKVNFKPF